MTEPTTIDCLEFRRLALADPNDQSAEFLHHRGQCAECRALSEDVLSLDRALVSSLDAPVPPELRARLQLARTMSQKQGLNWRSPRAIAASLAAALIIATAGFNVGVVWTNTESVTQDYALLLEGVMEHLNEHPMQQVWETDRANKAVSAVLTNYDASLTLNYMENLQFGRICPMGRYKGLHATLETPEGQISFAYFKGEAVAELQDVTMNGYRARVKPVAGGNLIIVSANSAALESADRQLEQAMVWDI